MKKLCRKCLAGALALTMAVSVASMQASAAQAEGVPVSLPVMQENGNNEAMSNSIGLGNEANNLLTMEPYGDWVTYGVNLFSGNLVASMPLYEEGYPYPRDLTFTYNSLDGSDFGFGRGFRTNYSMELKDNQDGTYTFIDATGTPFLFSNPDQYGVYTDCQGHTLQKYPEGYAVTDGSMNYGFNQEGILTNVSGGGMATHRETQLTYDGQGNLVKVYSPKAGYLESTEYRFTYSNLEGHSEPRVTQITAVQGEKEDEAVIYTFQYDENGLYSVTGNNGKSFNCEIDPETELLTRFGPDEITYMPGGEGVVASNVNGNYQYLYGNLQTVVNANGTLTLYRFDESGMLIE